MKLGDIEVIYSDRKNGVCRHWLGSMIKKEAAEFCLGWEGISNRMLVSHLMKNTRYQ